jgi:demethylmenaquinone methyltransferase / 2-methoxy-6-polyprenyl-1,4-benzoquinol methylase
MFNQIAQRYDAINHILSAGIDRCWRKKAARLLQKYEPQNILDLASGTADFALAICKAIKNANVTGIDISEEMLKIGRVKILKKGLEQRIRLDPGDAEQTGFNDVSFDAATIAFGIRNIQNTNKALREMHRVLKGQGVLLILEFSMPRSGLFAKIYTFYFNHILPLLGGLISGNYTAYNYFISSVKKFPLPEKFIEQLQSCGFQIEVSRPLTGGVAWIYLVRKYQN